MKNDFKTVTFVILSKVEVEKDIRTYFSLLLKLKSRENKESISSQLVSAVVFTVPNTGIGQII